MKRHQRLKSLVICCVFSLPILALATDQEHDTISFAGEAAFVLECPLAPLLEKRSNKMLFDVIRTSNWKGYEASWEIKGTNLLLTSFYATRKGDPIEVDFLFPRRNPPILADWYSGSLHVPSGKWTKRREGWSFERLAVLQVTNGVVKSSVHATNVDVRIRISGVKLE